MKMHSITYDSASLHLNVNDILTHLPVGFAFKDTHFNYEKIKIQIRSKKQAECLVYLIRGKRTKEIAKILNRSPRTIEEHIEKLKEQFNCFSKSELIDKAFEIGFANIMPISLFAEF